MKYFIRSILYPGVAAVTLYLAVIYKSQGMLLFCGMAVCLPPVFLCLLFSLRRKISYVLSVPETVQDSTGMEKIGIRVHNDGSMPVIIKGRLLLKDMKSGKKHKKKLRGKVSAGQEIQISGNWKEAEPGIWQVSCKGIWIYESFGWFCLWKREKAAATVVVLPECFETGIQVGIRTRLFFSDGEQYHPQWNGDDPAEIFKLREYREGDRMNRIHWKLSARNDMLIVKEMSMPLGCNVVFFLNTDERTAKRSAYWKIVHTICAGMLEQECFHYLAWKEPDREKMTRKAVRGEEDLYEFWVELQEHRFETGGLKQRYDREFMGQPYVSYLELNEKLELSCNGTWLLQFTEDKVQEQLQGMELIL